jgi:ABC-type nitrate/sulfonate/bicarbonate transport system substrate-binding protein
MRTTRRGRPSTAATIALTVAGMAGCANSPPQETVTVRVNVFRGASNIPIYTAIEQGYFAKRGIQPELQFTPNSTQQRAGLAAGRFDIAHAAVDNAVAIVEVAKHDAVIVAGGDAGMNEFLVRREINQPADLRGRTYVVDAPNTAYALTGRKILKSAGLADGKDYQLNPLGGSEARTKAFEVPANAATMLNPPWSIIAKEQGAKSLGRTIDLFGHYQASGVFVMRQWARANSGVLERYLAAYIEGCRAAQDPANRARTIAILERELKLTPKVAEITYQELNTPRHGMARDCAFDLDGFRNVLALRAEIEGQWGGTPPSPDRYLELGYFERAMRTVGAR